jgi:hypothetical protein
MIENGRMPDGSAQRQARRFSMRNFRTILQHQHDRLDRAFASYLAAQEAGSGRTPRRLTLFLAALERHMRMEETVLFPFIGGLAAGSEDGTLIFLKSEHRQIRGAMMALRNAGVSAAARIAANWLAAALWRHEQVEDLVLGPWLEMLTDPQRRSLRILLQRAA